jgi:hypothetical protein
METYFVAGKWLHLLRPRRRTDREPTVPEKFSKPQTGDGEDERPAQLYSVL